MRASGNTELRAFIAVAERGSFAQAAESLGVTPSALSQTIRSLEERLGVRLFQRTTRSVAISEAGERLLRRVRPALEELDGALLEASTLRAEPAGMVRVRCLRVAYRRFVEPILPAFRAAYPEVQLDILVDDVVNDLVASGFDVGFTLGEVIERDMTSVRIGGEFRQIAVASPDYLERHGKPRRPNDLLAHDCIRWRWPGRTTPYKWEFFAKGAWFEVEVSGALILSEQQMTVDAAVRGLGIAFWLEDQVRPHIEEGRLVSLLEPYCKPFPGLHICYPQQRQMAPALRAFIDFARRHAD